MKGRGNAGSSPGCTDQKENLLKVQDKKNVCKINGKGLVANSKDCWKWMHTRVQPHILQVKLLWLDIILYGPLV